jgi:hypothetical protein
MTSRVMKHKITNEIHAGAFTFHKDGSVTAKWSYFYHFDRSPEKYAEMIKTKFPEAHIIETGDHYHDFVGGSKVGSATSSYMWVRFDMGV